MAFLHETKTKGDMDLQYCPTEFMCADVFTKHFTVKQKWDHAISLIGHVDSKRLWNRGSQIPDKGGGAKTLRNEVKEVQGEDERGKHGKVAVPANSSRHDEHDRTLI